MIYITGDTHTSADDILKRIKDNDIQKGDILIVLGDFGANFFLNVKDTIFKERLQETGVTFFAIHGNHEVRPQNFKTYKTKEWNCGEVMYEKEYPNILFAIDGEVYNLDGNKTMTIGGAYSVDKYYRAFRTSLYMTNDFTSDEFEKIAKVASSGPSVTKEMQKEVDKLIKRIPENLMHWWSDEQPNRATKKKCEEMLEKHGWEVDVILTHTCPEKFEPREMFLDGLNQDLVDKSTEKWLDKIEKKTDYKLWYAGHYHADKVVNDKFKLMFTSVEEFAKELSKELQAETEHVEER